jgi:hypothetical protein
MVSKSRLWGGVDVDIYDSGMDVMYNTLEAACKQLEHKTGCAVTILIGGPQPRLAGKITTWW